MARKTSKRKANYQRSTNPEVRCSTCAHFFVRNGTGMCQVVSGIIDPNFVSDLWTPDFFPSYEYEGRQGSLTRI